MNTKSFEFWLERGLAILEDNESVSVSDLVAIGADKETANQVVAYIAEMEGNEPIVFRKPGGRG